MLIRFFKDLWGVLFSFNLAAYIVLLFIAGLITFVFFVSTATGPVCTKYTILYRDYRFHVDNYSMGNNSITFRDGTSNVTLMGNFAIYENNCSKER